MPIFVSDMEKTPTRHRIVVAPDSFKGCLSSGEVARIVADALRSLLPGADIAEHPLADGGEGTLDILAKAMEADIYEAAVTGPSGRETKARYGLSGDTAIIEVAEACGLHLLTRDELKPLDTGSRGVGELLLAARERGAKAFIVGLGGTATCDGGSGMMEVPHIREALEGCAFELLADVDNPFVGPRGAARVFAPQKGASPEDVEILEKRLLSLSETILRQTGTDVRRLPGAGAAGGLGGAMAAYFHASISSGIEKVLRLTRFCEAAKGASLIVTGEGRSDLQTLCGKVPYGVLRNSGGTPVALMSGRIENGKELLEAGFAVTVQVSPDGLPAVEAVKGGTAAANLRLAAGKLIRDYPIIQRYA